MEPSWNLTSGPPRTTPEPIWAETPKLSAVGEKCGLLSWTTPEYRGKGEFGLQAELPLQSVHWLTVSAPDTRTIILHVPVQRLHGRLQSLGGVDQKVLTTWGDHDGNQPRLKKKGKWIHIYIYMYVTAFTTWEKGLSPHGKSILTFTTWEKVPMVKTGGPFTEPERLMACTCLC